MDGNLKMKLSSPEELQPLKQQTALASLIHCVIGTKITLANNSSDHVGGKNPRTSSLLWF